MVRCAYHRLQADILSGWSVSQTLKGSKLVAGGKRSDTPGIKHKGSRTLKGCQRPETQEQPLLAETNT